jgi:hypothetical protein
VGYIQTKLDMARHLLTCRSLAIYEMLAIKRQKIVTGVLWRLVPFAPGCRTRREFDPQQEAQRSGDATDFVRFLTADERQQSCKMLAAARGRATATAAEPDAGPD